MDPIETTASAKGQIVIPARLRRKYGIKRGTRVQVTDDGERIILRPVTPETVRRLRGALKGGHGLRVLAEDRRAEAES